MLYNSQLFEERATTTMSISPHPFTLSSDTVLLAFGIGIILALGALFVLKSVRYDEIIQSPFGKNK